MLYAEMNTDDISTAGESTAASDSGITDDSCVTQATEMAPFDVSVEESALREVKDEFPDVSDVNDECCVNIKKELECGTSAFRVRLCLFSVCYILIIT